MDKHGLKGLVFPRWAIGKFLETLPQLIEVASGLRKADLVVRNVNLVDVAGGRVVENVSIVAYSGFIAALVSASDDEVYIGPSTMVINGGGSYAAPGFINAHVHVETSFLRPSEFSKLALMHGATMIVTDPHNIANAGGLKHLLAFTEEAIRQPLKVLVQVPSCVPPTRSEVDNPGYTLSIKDVEELLDSGLFHSLGSSWITHRWLTATLRRLVRLTYLSPRFRTPIYAHLLDLTIMAALITLAGIFYGTSTALYGATVGALMYFMAVALAPY